MEEISDAKKEEELSARLESCTAKLIERLEDAIDQLDCYLVSTKTKEKEYEYNEEEKKVLREKVVEREDVRVEKGNIDRRALKELVSTLVSLRGGESEVEAEQFEVVMSDDAREFSK